MVTEADLGNTDLVSGGPFVCTDHFIQAKVLAGDSSEGRPGVSGVGLKTAAKFIREHGTFEALCAKYDGSEPLKGVVLQRAAGPEYRDTYRRNLKLIDWCLGPPPGRNFQLEIEHRDHPAFTSSCEKRGLEEIFESWQGYCIDRERGIPGTECGPDDSGGGIRHHLMDCWCLFELAYEFARDRQIHSQAAIGRLKCTAAMLLPCATVKR